MNNHRPSLFPRLLAVVLFMLAIPASADRVKDLVNVAGVRENQLVGYGLVVGLSGTGDQTSQAPFTIQSIRNMLTGFGVRVPDNVNPQLKNVAAVTIHANLPAFAKPGQTIDVTVSSIGNAASLRGGSLLMAPMMGADGQVYAVAQGSLLVSGLGVEGNDGSRVTVNIPSAGRIPNGAIVERPAPSQMASNGEVMLNLKTPDFTTARRLSEKINEFFGAGTASAMDSATVKVLGPSSADRRVTFISMLEELEVDPAEARARVVVNSRTGTIVIGGNVRVMPTAVTHGSLTVSVTERVDISQPNAFADGQTVAAGRSSIDVAESGSRMFLLDAGVTLEEIVKAINQVGAAPGDLVAILEALNQAGALRAELLVIQMDISKAGNYHDFSGLAALRSEAQADSEQAIAPVARQFEALFLQMMLKSMRDAVPEGGLFDSNGGELYQEMHDKQLSVTLSEQGGIGLADAIAQQLSGHGVAPGAALTEQGAQLRQQLLTKAAQVSPLTADNLAAKRGI